MNQWQLLSQNISTGINLGFFELKYYSLFIAMALILGWLISTYIAKRQLINTKQIENIYFNTIIWGIIGARLYHVIDFLEYYIKNPLQIIAIWQGGIGIFGALIGGLIGLVFNAKQYQLKITHILNTISPSLLLGQAIGRWGNFFNQEGFGSATDLPWGIYISPNLRPEQSIQNQFYHPVFLYESLLCIVGFFILFYLYKKHNKFDYLFGLYCIIYGSIRLFTENFRIDTATVSTLKLATILSITMIIIGIVNIHRQWKLQSAKIHQS